MLRFHHVGIATKSIDSALSLMLFNANSTRVYDPEQKCTLQFCKVYGDDSPTLIELIEGEGVKGLVKKCVHAYHICYDCGSTLKDEVDIMKRNGATQFTEIKPMAIMSGYSCAFFYTSELGIIELIGRI